MVDTLPIEEPEDVGEGFFYRTLRKHTPLELSSPFDVLGGEALNLTHSDDVVSSAWWVRRMGYRDIGPAELARGPTSPGGAPAPGPLTVSHVRDEGTAPGLTLHDSRGRTYFVKLDPPGFLHLRSAAGVIANRLVWGAGYHVPEDYPLAFEASRLRIGEDATITDVVGESSLSQEGLRELLQRMDTLPDGRHMALASRRLPGALKGSFVFEGTRDDDPNDHYRHQHRRELRALQVVASWVNNTQTQVANTMDVYVEGDYLRHYVVDLGSALGSAGGRPKHPKDAAEQPVDLWNGLARFLSLGFYRRDWEEMDGAVADSALGFLRVEEFRPGAWQTMWNTPAFQSMTPADAYWAAKIVASFTDDHLRAVVEAGGLPDVEDEDTMTSVLRIRRDTLVHHWFQEVTPVEDVHIAGRDPGGFELAFRDLAVEHGVRSGDELAYAWRLEHGARKLEVEGVAEAEEEGAERVVRVRWREGDEAAEEDPGPSRVERLATLELSVAGAGGRPATVWLEWKGPELGYEVVGLQH